jgi:enoyl-CoA hydratase/carnithine racemase
MAEYQTVLFEKGAATHVATVTINRPDQMNSFNYEMCMEFVDIWKRCKEDDEIHVILLRAAAGRAFSTGIDVSRISDPTNPLVATDEFNAVDPGEFLGAKHNKCWKPLIVAVHGMCAGGGFYWINEADIVICSEDATFFDPHVTYGMTSALEPYGALARGMPLPDVLRMVLLGNDERIGAMTAMRLGIVSEVLPLDQLYDRARELAEQVAAKPTQATQGSLKAIWQSLDMPRSVALATALNYCQLGNPKGMAQADRNKLMADKAKKYTIR